VSHLLGILRLFENHSQILTFSNVIKKGNYKYLFIVLQAVAVLRQQD